MRVHQQSAFVLLNRPYSESSWIVEIFSREYGRLALMAKGARRAKSKLKAVLMPFQPLLLSWTGKGEIPTLTSAEIDLGRINIAEHELCGDALVCGFYCNELMVDLLHRHDPHPRLYDHYLEIMLVLGANSSAALNTFDGRAERLPQQLREFERIVIRETGYEINFKFEADGKTPIVDDNYYCFQRGQGFLPAMPNQPKAVSGKVIRSMFPGNANTPDTAKTGTESISSDQQSQGKLLMRDILNQTLGYKKVVSRELFFPKRSQAKSNVASAENSG